ncbi:protein-L-isoaspartate O-methyltransferase [Polymorphobacter sp. PAMC 29334]|uniref:protein-L-isoaspartate O-methyltransferase family protein n=1 Tax=Polymorphobacter sp. PAMC 29334 TaxID=2862331 RepID=UPI001C75087A|nr:protein-L-isoaspartate O-methyltransferase [Polymorphobacter sp. PAMC 29334]QYE35811.1 protein-L-isoaspartate O-methyltransferase [Polymorphobacter sp. PAMC 29334]
MMFETMREAMVESQLRPTGVNDPVVLAAIRAVPRERFVPPARTGLAYADTAIEIAPGRWLLEPLVTGLLLTHARIMPSDRVLVVGAGTGYAAAIIRHLSRHVTAVEENSGLVAAAQANGVDVVTGPLADGWAARAPYDLIFIDGAAAVLPSALLAQSADDGRLAAVIIGDDGVGRATVGRVAGGHFAGTGFFDTGAVALPGFGRAPKFIF